MIIFCLFLWALIGGVSNVVIEHYTSKAHHPLIASFLFGPLEIPDLLKAVKPMPNRNEIGALRPFCCKCRAELPTYGAIVLSPPVAIETNVIKSHLCDGCWDKFVKWTKRK